MSYMVEHVLSAPNFKQMLLNAGVIEARVLHGTGGREVNFPSVLNMQKCCEEEWAKDEKVLVEYGVYDFSKKNLDGEYGVRRDLTEQEIEELKYWPIVFNEDDEINWLCKWERIDDPAFFISKLFPDISFDYNLYYEDQWDGGFTVIDGVFKETEDWKAHMEEVNKKRSEVCDELDQNNSDDTICFDYESDDTLPF